jgi:hypothetical protein
MDPWQSIILAFGGNAVLLALLGWLARSLGSQLLAKDIEKFKAELAAASTATTDRLKHELQLAAVEHQVQFSKLHERRAEVVADLYGLLVETHWASQSFVSVMEWAGEPPKHEKYVTAMNMAAEFYRYFDKNRIYLPHPLCEQLEHFIRNMRSRVIEFGVYVSINDVSPMPEHVLKQKHDVWTKASDYFDKEVPNARSALENELRSILAPSKPTPS